jgi:hypothetical protein
MKTYKYQIHFKPFKKDIQAPDYKNFSRFVSTLAERCYNSNPVSFDKPVKVSIHEPSVIYANTIEEAKSYIRYVLFQQIAWLQRYLRKGIDEDYAYDSNKDIANINGELLGDLISLRNRFTISLNTQSSKTILDDDMTRVALDINRHTAERDGSKIRQFSFYQDVFNEHPLIQASQKYYARKDGNIALAYGGNYPLIPLKFIIKGALIVPSDIEYVAENPHLFPKLENGVSKTSVYTTLSGGESFNPAKNIVLGNRMSSRDVDPTIYENLKKIGWDESLRSKYVKTLIKRNIIAGGKDG